MDDTTKNTGETDDFSRLLAQLNPPTTAPVHPSLTPSVLDFEAMFPPPAPPSASPAAPVSAPPATPLFGQSAAPPTALRAPELMGADELASSPMPFPPVPVDVTPLIVPPLLPVPPGSDALTSSRSSTNPTPAPVDFAAALTAPPMGDGGTPPAGFLGLVAGAAAGWSDEPDIGRSTVGEKIILPVAILLPPIGLIAAIVAAIMSAQRRGWVIGILKAAMICGVILSVVAGIGGYIGYTQFQQRQRHDQIVAASAAFCATIKANPTMTMLPTFGWPAVAASIPDSLTAMQAYEDRWTKLAKVSPDAIKPEVQKIATAAKQIIDGVTVARTVNDASNISVMSAAASASGVPAWHAEYCG